MVEQVERRISSLEDKERLFEDTSRLIREGEGFVLFVAHKNGRVYRVVYPGFSAIRLAYALAEYAEEVGL